MRYIIETPRLLMREMGMGDFKDICSILQDERVMYAYNGAFSDEETSGWIERQIKRYAEYKFGLWAVLLRESGKIIGQCGITMQEYDGRLVPEIGYLFAYDYWHHGYATESAAACKDYGFNTLHFDTLYSIIRDTNTASINVALRNGMRPSGTLTKHYRGTEMPHIVYSISAASVQ